jgi:hypothetical protein
MVTKKSRDYLYNYLYNYSLDSPDLFPYTSIK